MNTSIIIPTWGTHHLLEKCLNSIYENTDISKIEIIIVCNGSDDLTLKLVKQNNLTFVWYEKAIGFTKAANSGFKLSTKSISIIMNTDAIILPYWPQNKWIETLIDPIVKDNSVGISGLTRMRSEWGDYIPFFCTAIQNKLFSEIGYLDEDFSPGYGEDLDFCNRIKENGYKIQVVHEGIEDHNNQRVLSTFPIYHPGEQSFSPEQKKECLQNAKRILERKWSK